MYSREIFWKANKSIGLDSHKYHTSAFITRGLYSLFEVQKRFFKGIFFLKFWLYVWLVFKSGFESRAGYSGARTVFFFKFFSQPIGLVWSLLFIDIIPMYVYLCSQITDTQRLNLKELTVPKWVLAEITPNVLNNFSPKCLTKPKSSGFLKKKSLWVSIVRFYVLTFYPCCILGNHIPTY
jgi:hypothetical protein